MTPCPQRWTPATLELVVQPDGTYAGAIQWDGQTIWVRNWRKDGARVVCEMQHEADAFIEELFVGRG